MSDLEWIKQTILDKYFYEEIELSNKEYHELPENERSKCYGFDSDLFNQDMYYKKNLEILPEDLNTAIMLKSFEAQMETFKAQMESKNAIITIKNIVVFVFVVNIIATILIFIFINNAF